MWNRLKCKVLEGVEAFVQGHNNHNSWEKIMEMTNKNCNVPMEEIIITTEILLKKLNNIIKSTGPDGIHPRILYEVTYEIADALYIIFNESMIRYQMPVDWKTAHITVVHKRTKKTVCNVFPVSCHMYLVMICKTTSH